ncbi:MAG: fructose PTS transporter subunit IIA [Tetragenococcus halophilus]|nr:fructose PTS transporter subunit IIA [Tetragenococcus halophilus]
MVHNSKMSDFISTDNIIVGMNAVSREDAIKQLSNILQKNGVVNDAVAFNQDVLAREKQSTTGIGINIAIPHGKSASVNIPSFIFAKNNSFLDWDSLDGSQVDIIFLMAIQEKDERNEHLEMLANISSRLMDDQFVESIKKENDPQRLLKIFTEN